MSEFEEKILNLLKDIDKKLDKVLGAEGSAPASTEVPAEVMPAASKAEPAAKPSEVVTKQAEAEAPEEAPSVEGRRVCPKCSATEFNQIEDKSKILHSMGGIKIYAKNYQCRSCGFIL